jgi:TonB family protein
MAIRWAGVSVLVAASCAATACASARPKITTVTVEADALVPPRAIRQSGPGIPQELWGDGCRNGSAVVEVDVGTAGEVKAARLSRSSGTAVFDEACVRSAFEWRYEPATHAGHAVPGKSEFLCELRCPSE